MNYERIYEYRLRGTKQEARIGVWGKVARYLYDQLGRPQRVIDPAAGRGEFINQVPAAERWAVERMASARKFLDAKVRFVEGDFFEVPLPEAHFDGAFASNVLEHLASPAEVSRFLERLYRLISPGGRIAILGPNFRYCAKDYFDCSDHTLTLTHHSVAEHLYAVGFEPTRIVPRFLPYSFRGRLPASPVLTQLYLRTPIAWPLLGKQFLLVAEKRGPL